MTLSTTVTPSELATALKAVFPLTAQSWSQATDELRDMSRWAREALELDEIYAADFRVADTPEQWNAIGTYSVIRFFTDMKPEVRVKFIEKVNEYFPELF